MQGMSVILDDGAAPPTSLTHAFAGALILDTSSVVSRTFHQPQQPILLRRGDTYEKQHRLVNAAGLFFAYRSEEGSPLLYILQDALSTTATKPASGKA